MKFLKGKKTQFLFRIVVKLLFYTCSITFLRLIDAQWRAARLLKAAGEQLKYHQCIPVTVTKQQPNVTAPSIASTKFWRSPSWSIYKFKSLWFCSLAKKRDIIKLAGGRSCLGEMSSYEMKRSKLTLQFLGLKKNYMFFIDI